MSSGKALGKEGTGTVVRKTLGRSGTRSSWGPEGLNHRYFSFPNFFTSSGVLSPCPLLYVSVLSLMPLSIHGTFRSQSSWAPYEVVRPLPCVQLALLLCLLPSFVSLSSCPPSHHTSLYKFAVFFVSGSTLLSPLLPACYNPFFVQRQKHSPYNFCCPPANTIFSS